MAALLGGRHERMFRKWYLVLAVVLCLPLAWWIVDRQRHPRRQRDSNRRHLPAHLATARKQTISALALRFDAVDSRKSARIRCWAARPFGFAWTRAPTSSSTSPNQPAGDVDQGERPRSASAIGGMVIW